MLVIRRPPKGGRTQVTCDQWGEGESSSETDFRDIQMGRHKTAAPSLSSVDPLMMLHRLDKTKKHTVRY